MSSKTSPVRFSASGAGQRANPTLEIETVGRGPLTLMR